MYSLNKLLQNLKGKIIHPKSSILFHDYLSIDIILIYNIVLIKLLASLASANHQTYQDVTTVYGHLATKKSV